MKELPITTSVPRRLFLLFELAALFLAIPAILWAGYIKWNVLIVLWAFTAVCLTILLLDPTFSRRRLWNTEHLKTELPTIVSRFASLALVLLGLVYFLRPDMLFGFVRRLPWVWLIVMVLYPILSVYPQGLVFRVFFFHRYRALFPSGALRIAASSLAFGYMHIVFDNWVAPILTLVGGSLFAWTYHRTQSALVASIEHALYGCFIITVGLGTFVYKP